jgi:hypothetical protein
LAALSACALLLLASGMAFPQDGDAPSGELAPQASSEPKPACERKLDDWKARFKSAQDQMLEAIRTSESCQRELDSLKRPQDLDEVRSSLRQAIEDFQHKLQELEPADKSSNE